MSKTIDFKPLFVAAAAAGAASAKVAAEIQKLLKGKRKAQADTIKQAAYAQFLGERKARELQKEDRRTYDAMRQGFSRYYAGMKWTTKAKPSNSEAGFTLEFSKSVKPESIIKSIKALAEYLRAEHKDESILRLAAFLADIE